MNWNLFWYRRWLGLSILFGGLLIDVSAWAYGVGCPWCASEPAVVSSASPLLHTTIKWCGISEAPAIANPAIVCESSFRDHMWRRHERASECVWIPQCRITLRSGAGFIFHNNYVMFNDLSTTIGAPGDIVVSPITEMDAAWLNCDLIWNTPTPQPKGIIAISARLLIDSSGTEVARGIAYVGSITQPWMAVKDASLLCQLNERSLAHEFGHVLGLNHVTTAGNLMQTGGTGATLTPAQCTTARAYVTANPIIDPPAALAAAAGVDRVAFAFDELNDRPGEQPFIDIRKIAAVDTTPTGGNLMLCLGTRGLVPAGVSNLQYWILLDTDNNPNTGGRPTGLVPGAPMGGVELVCQIQRTGSNTVASLYEPGEFGPFVPVLLAPGRLSAALRNINLVICDPLPEYRGPTEIPSFSELDFGFTRQALIDVGLLPGAAIAAQAGEGVFPAGLRIQAVAALPGTQNPDMAPAEGGQMQFPKIEFPVLRIPANARRGEVVAAAVEKLPPLAPLKVMFGPEMLPITPRTDAEGRANFEFVVPANAEIRPTLITVGLLDPENAATADAVIDIELAAERPVLAIRYENPANNLVAISWTPPGAEVLQAAEEVTGPWVDVLGAGNPHVIPAAGVRRFYRIGPSQPPPEAPAFNLPEFGTIPEGASNVTDHGWAEIPGGLNDDLMVQMRGAAEADPEVRRLLGERFHFISVTEVVPDKGTDPQPGGPVQAMVTFVSYPSNWTTVEVSMSGTNVRAVSNRVDRQPHEGASEIEEAIAAAREHPELGLQVRNLIGTGLLELVENPDAPGFNHRVIYTGFVTNGGGDDQGAEAPLYFARYDLNDRRILGFGRVDDADPPAGGGAAAGELAGFLCPGPSVLFPLVFPCVGNPAQSGSTTWTPPNGNTWQFTWRANTGCGLSLHDVRYRGRYYLYKADLPVVKVKYNPNVIGPYNDILTWGNMKCTTPTQKVRQQQFFFGGHWHLQLWIYSHIGSYRLIQAYTLRDDGWLLPRLGSKGLQTCKNHWHAPHWQFDYDLDGAANDSTYRWSPGWTLLPGETDGFQPSGAPILGQDCVTGRRVWTYGCDTCSALGGPGCPPDPCSPGDYALRLFQGGEGCPWPYPQSGSVCFAPTVPWNNGQNVVCRDNVLWHIGHLYHPVDNLHCFCAKIGKPGDFKWTGPCLRMD